MPLSNLQEVMWDATDQAKTPGIIVVPFFTPDTAGGNPEILTNLLGWIVPDNLDIYFDLQVPYDTKVTIALDPNDDMNIIVNAISPSGNLSHFRYFKVSVASESEIWNMRIELSGKTKHTGKWVFTKATPDEGYDPRPRPIVGRKWVMALASIPVNG